MENGTQQDDRDQQVTSPQSAVLLKGWRKYTLIAYNILLAIGLSTFSTKEQQSMRVLKLSIIAFAVMLISFNALASDANEFEGKYQVGSTTCTVKPIKMAFEVRWTKGKGVMVFFFDRETPEGGYVYVSEEKAAGRDRFEFDNERLVSGKFIRSDGEVLLVRKISPQAHTGGQ